MGRSITYLTAALGWAVDRHRGRVGRCGGRRGRGSGWVLKGLGRCLDGGGGGMHNVAGVVVMGLGDEQAHTSALRDGVEVNAPHAHVEAILVRNRMEVRLGGVIGDHVAGVVETHQVGGEPLGEGNVSVELVAGMVVEVGCTKPLLKPLLDGSLQDVLGQAGTHVVGKRGSHLRRAEMRGDGHGEVAVGARAVAVGVDKGGQAVGKGVSVIVVGVVVHGVGCDWMSKPEPSA